MVHATYQPSMSTQCWQLEPSNGKGTIFKQNLTLSSSVHNLADFLPRWKGLEGHIDDIEFRNVLNSLSLPLNTDQYNKLWNR